MKKQENPLAVLLKETVYNHDYGDLAIEANDLSECVCDLRNWIKDETKPYKARIADLEGLLKEMNSYLDTEDNVQVNRISSYSLFHLQIKSEIEMSKK